ncbi:putative DNA-binding transcriptional regulator AlpA [Crossiella equi]|uniref:DNA-binding transcriptional regulator AlpA n=1 Tax=Crossiella equi TaxID=130796 RepID=A0ABS5ACF4_9PSEU|nr:helix-turn-helix domain-containing protein [Crossiella equi]MBP2474021.1 putative DNA-binding transcriptional regulator AlpA [Crossiella equi]
MGKLWDIKELADFLGIPVNTIYQWRSKNYGPPGRRIGKYLKFRPEDVYAWVESLPGEVT